MTQKIKKTADELKDQIDVIRQSGMFDEKYYLKRYPDVPMLGMDPIEHYLWLGAKLNRNPSAQFDTAAYLELNVDVALAGLNPLVHYIKWGQAEGRERAVQRQPGRSIEAGLHSSTFGVHKPYAFSSVEKLKALGQSYFLKDLESKNIAVFSSVTAQYDPIVFHEKLIDQADYYIFSDSNPEDSFVYKVHSIPYHDEDPVRAARFVKTHPHMLLSEYDIAVWMDGNILVRDDLMPLIRSFRSSGLPVAAVPHPLRSSVYEEAQECIKRNKDDAAVIEAQMQRYRSEQFDTSELIESNFMMFRLDHPTTPLFLNAWWREIEQGSRRDQLSFNYSLKKVGGRYFPLTEKPDSVRNHPALALFHHGTNHSPHLPGLAHARPPALRYSDVRQPRIMMQTGKKVDVVVCVHNALEVVQLCLNSVAANRNQQHHRIVIVDDGSDEITASWLLGFSKHNDNVLLIRNDRAGGYTKAANAGLRAMSAEMAILLNSDTIVAGFWIEKMLDAVESNPGVGIVGPLSSAASHQSIPEHRSSAEQTAINDLPDGYTVADMNRWCEENSSDIFLPRVPLVHGFCFGITREVVQKVGLLDEINFPNGYGEENDYCFRTADAGFSLMVATHTYVYHKKSQSYQDSQRLELVKAGNMKVRDLHGRNRVLRAVRNMQTNPDLDRLRKAAAELYVPQTSWSRQ